MVRIRDGEFNKVTNALFVGTSPLCEAVWFQEEEITRLLLFAGAKITQSHYLLHSAVFCNNIVIARLLLEAGSLPNLINNLGETAIFPAVRRGDTEMVHLLLEYGKCASFSIIPIQD